MEAEFRMDGNSFWMETDVAGLPRVWKTSGISAEMKTHFTAL